MAPLGAMTDAQGARSSKGIRGHNFLKLTLEHLKLQMKSKKKMSWVFLTILVEGGHGFFLEKVYETLL